MFKSINHVLVLAPHADDGEIGCGGTIARFIEEKKKVSYVSFSTAATSDPEKYPDDDFKDEVRNATKNLGIKSENLITFDFEVRKLNFVRQDILEVLWQLNKENEVDLVLIPSLKDIHQDHRTVSQEAQRAFKTKTILGYELIWNNFSIDTACFIRLQKRHIEKKIKALQEYKSQSSKTYMNPEFIYSLAMTRGVQINSRFAECFEVVRWIMD